MSSSSIRSQISTLEKKAADYARRQSRHVTNAAKASENANRKIDQANKTKSESTRRMHINAAEREAKKHADENKKVADLGNKIAAVNKQLSDKAKALQSVLKQEQAKEEREAKAKLTKQKREDENRRRTEINHAKEIARLSQPTVRHVVVQPPKPEKLLVLYLTADAISKSEQNQQPLRVDAEVNNVLNAIRGAKFREQVDLHVIPAASPQDLINGINDYRPHIVHFSGHGNSGLLALDNASLSDPQTEIVEFDTLAELLSATDTPPKLLVMNACNTLKGAELLLEAVPVLIAMSEPIGDAGAGVFATQFYSAIASAQSVGSALRQAKAMMKQALLTDDSDLPQMLCRYEIKTDELHLIKIPQK